MAPRRTASTPPRAPWQRRGNDPRSKAEAARKAEREQAIKDNADKQAARKEASQRRADMEKTRIEQGVPESEIANDKRLRSYKNQDSPSDLPAREAASKEKVASIKQSEASTREAASDFNKIRARGDTAARIEQKMENAGRIVNDPELPGAMAARGEKLWDAAAAEDDLARARASTENGFIDPRNTRERLGAGPETIGERLATGEGPGLPGRAANIDAALAKGTSPARQWEVWLRDAANPNTKTKLPRSLNQSLAAEVHSGVEPDLSKFSATQAATHRRLMSEARDIAGPNATPDELARTVNMMGETEGWANFERIRHIPELSGSRLPAPAALASDLPAPALPAPAAPVLPPPASTALPSALPAPAFGSAPEQLALPRAASTSALPRGRQAFADALLEARSGPSTAAGQLFPLSETGPIALGPAASLPAPAAAVPHALAQPRLPFEPTSAPGFSAANPGFSPAAGTLADEAVLGVPKPALPLPAPAAGGLASKLAPAVEEAAPALETAGVKAALPGLFSKATLMKSLGPGLAGLGVGMGAEAIGNRLVDKQGAAHETGQFLQGFGKAAPWAAGAAPILASLLPFEAAAGPVGWGIAGASALGLGLGNMLLGSDRSEKDDLRDFLSAEKVDNDTYGQAMDRYGALTDSGTDRKTALEQVKQQVSQAQALQQQTAAQTASTPQFTVTPEQVMTLQKMYLDDLAANRASYENFAGQNLAALGDATAGMSPNVAAMYKQRATDENQRMIEYFNAASGQVPYLPIQDAIQQKINEQNQVAQMLQQKRLGAMFPSSSSSSSDLGTLLGLQAA